jgi:hypothetical protein
LAFPCSRHPLPLFIVLLTPARHERRAYRRLWAVA